MTEQAIIARARHARRRTEYTVYNRHYAEHNNDDNDSYANRGATACKRNDRLA